MVEKDSNSELDQLKLSPTVLAWELEIRRVLLGQREYMLLRLGGSQEYIEVIQESSADEALTRTTFNAALRNVVQSWQPSRPESAAYFSHMLELIGAYAPPEGFIKVLGFLNSRRYFGENVTTPDSPVSGKDLHMKALVVLQYYYLAAPPMQSDDIAFQQYLNVLREHLHEPQYCDYALRRLYELSAISLDDADVLNAVQASGAVITQLVTSILKSRDKTRVARDLSSIYSHCLRSKDCASRFEGALVACGARLEHDDQGPLVYLSESDLIVLTLPEDVESYVLVRWNTGQERGMTKLRELAETEGGEIPYPPEPLDLSLEELSEIEVIISSDRLM
jgi:hypothetical protein